MSRYRILVVDDDEEIRRVLKLTLSTRYEVVEACDGLDALSKLEDYEPDFAIIDIMMPLMDGFQLCEAIRRHKSFKVMQVMFLSAHGSKDNIKKSYASGANLFMQKPVEPERLLRNVDFTIQHELPPLRNKKYSIEQIRQMEAEKSGAAPAPAAEPAPSRLAAAPQRPAAAPPTNPMLAPVHGRVKPRLLVVDDDEEMLTMLAMALRDDYEVTVAVDGLDAIQRIVEYEPDMLLLDIMMPRMNGYQLLQSIRRNATYKNLPIVVISAKSTQRDIDYAIRLGANEFLAKPYRIDQLLKMIEAVAGRPGFQIQPKRLSIREIEKLQ
ncbi:MAG: response regulator [Candidatus Sumerlaeia bacterium]